MQTIESPREQVAFIKLKRRWRIWLGAAAREKLRPFYDAWSVERIWLTPSQTCSHPTNSELQNFRRSRIHFQTFKKCNWNQLYKSWRKHQNACVYVCVYVCVWIAPWRDFISESLTFSEYHFLFYLQVLWILLPLGGLHTCQRLSEVHTVSQPCRSSPGWQPRESFCQTSWDLTSSEFHRSSAWNLLCQTSMLICGDLKTDRYRSTPQIYRYMLVLALGCRGAWTNSGERESEFWRSPASFCDWLFPTQSRAERRYARQRGWGSGSCPPTGTDLERVCVCVCVCVCVW